jgi:hypothetical protein
MFPETDALLSFPEQLVLLRGVLGLFLGLHSELLGPERVTIGDSSRLQARYKPAAALL